MAQSMPTVADITNVEFNRKRPSYTYRMLTGPERIRGNIDKAKAIEQTIYCILHTERYDCPILSRNYGIEKRDLFGRPIDYAAARLESRIREALIQDDRITGITGYRAERVPGQRGALHVWFTAKTVTGDIDINTEVMF